MTTRRQPIDWQTIRERLEREPGAARRAQMWRSLEQLANDEAFRQRAQREFAAGAHLMREPLSRRRFLQLAAASLGLAGLSACAGEPAGHILPYVQPPVGREAGEAQFYATAFVLGGYAEGVLAESHEGRPTRVTGNTLHPASLGASDAFAQASVLTLYDPDRAREPLRDGNPATWAQFEAELGNALQQNSRLRLLTPILTSPALIAQIDALLERYPQARWQQYEPINWDNAYEGARLAFGRPLQALYDFSRADVILSLDADFLFTFPGRLHYTRDFSLRRAVHDSSQPSMNRLYAVSPTPTLTSAMADHHWSLRPAAVAAFAALVANELGVAVDAAVAPLGADLEAAAVAVANDLRANRGRSLVLAGLAQPPAVHALAHAINAALDNTGSTVQFIAPVPAQVDNQRVALEELVGEMEAGEVDALLILDGNPAYDAPVPDAFAAALARVPFTAHHSMYEDETSALCRWRLPAPHYLETWSDARAYDGTATILQPLIRPLFATRSAHELVAMLLGAGTGDALTIVRDYWQDNWQALSREAESFGDDFEAFWRRALHDGVVPASAFEPADAAIDPSFAPSLATEDDGALLTIVRPDASLWDGRFANNAWLQELPRPFSKITWGNAALVSPALAEEQELAQGDVLRLLQGQQEDAAREAILAPVFVLPGQAPGCITLHLGYGREVAGSVGQYVGFRVLPADNWTAPLARIEKTGEHITLATTQNHHSMEGRAPVRVATLAQLREDPALLGHEEVAEPPPSLYPEFEYEGHAWGMSIDLNTCIGCQACVVACQAENNIPVVGPEGVQQGREMHWLRVDDYFAGDLDSPRIYHQPVPCMHCEKAPCEPVCPVSATTHSAEGLNEMTYNRCVGTRYCANNCPYKVRRFNFMEYATDHELISLAYNPEVSVRERGVMEKCTYCVQRINEARQVARQEGRAIVDGDVQTACQEVCPANAIVFGDINDRQAQVTQRKSLPHDYALLAELGTQPRTTYLAKLVNLNEEMEE